MLDSEDNYDAHEQFTRLLLESEPVMMRSILVIVPHQDDAREIMQETAVALWRQFDSYDPARPFINWAMGFSRIHTRRFLARQQKRASLTSEAWLGLLDQAGETSVFTRGPGRLLAEGPYLQNASPADVDILLPLVANWVDRCGKRKLGEDKIGEAGL